MKRIFVITLMLLTFALLAGSIARPRLLYAFVLLGPLLLIGVYDLLQRRHTILRNYPIIGHMRYMLEDARHHIRQYLIQGDKEGDPFTRPERAVAYQRAKQASDVQPFGTLLNVYEEGHEWFEHSLQPLEPEQHETRVVVGGPDCTQPYSASHLNISAMSFGSLGARAIEALNRGAHQGGFAHNTGEGGLSRFHAAGGGDLIWQVGTGYFGCRTPDGGFDAEIFADKAGSAQVKMIEIKLSQGAKPGGGGILPGGKVTNEIAAARDVPAGKTVTSPAQHSAFSTAAELTTFIGRLRELSGGKPIGIKLCVGRRDEFMTLVKAMLESGIMPDFVTVDGSEGGTGAAPRELTDHVGLPLREGLMFVHNTLVGAGVRDRIRVICSGKIVDGFDVASHLAMGADLCNSARGMMFALGCIQARRCHANTCPTGIATHDKWRTSGLVVEDKAQRVANFHHGTIKHFLKMMAACGLADSNALHPGLLMRRISHSESGSYADIYPFLTPGALLDGTAPDEYQRVWTAAGSEWHSVAQPAAVGAQR